MKTTYDSFQHFLYLLQKSGIPPEQAIVILELQKVVMTKLIESSMQSLQAKTLQGVEKNYAVQLREINVLRLEHRIEALSNRIRKLSLTYISCMLLLMLIFTAAITLVIIRR